MAATPATKRAAGVKMDPASGEAVGVCVEVPLTVPFTCVPLEGNGSGDPVPVDSYTRLL